MQLAVSFTAIFCALIVRLRSEDMVIRQKNALNGLYQSVKSSLPFPSMSTFLSSEAKVSLLDTLSCFPSCLLSPFPPSCHRRERVTIDQTLAPQFRQEHMKIPLLIEGRVVNL